MADDRAPITRADFEALAEDDWRTTMPKRKRDNETDLRPCPFCGPQLIAVQCKKEPDGPKAPRRTTKEPRTPTLPYRVQCHTCGTRGPLHASPVYARAAWNERRTDRGGVRDVLRDIGDLD